MSSAPSNAAQAAGLEVRPLTPTIGAEILGVDLSRQPSAETVRAIRDALLEHMVVFFRDQDLSLSALGDLGRCFGTLHIHPSYPPVEGHPGIMRIHTDAASKVYAGRMWHSDVSCDAAPPMGSILHLREVPELGGDTLFASMYAAYDALSPHMQRYLAPLNAIHASAHNYGSYFGTGKGELRDREYPQSAHPLVCRHPETGRALLFVNETFTTAIEGVEPAESKAILEFLFAHIRQPRFHCRFRWRRNSVAFWDNRCAQHHALWDYYPATRSGHRATIAGTAPVRA